MVNKIFGNDFEPWRSTIFVKNLSYSQDLLAQAEKETKGHPNSYITPQQKGNTQKFVTFMNCWKNDEKRAWHFPAKAAEKSF